MASAMPPRVIALMVFPVAYRPTIEPRIASGMLSVAMSVMRQSPRNSRIISDTRTAPTTPSKTSEESAPRTAAVWSITRSSLVPSGRRDSMSGIRSRTPSTTARLLLPRWRYTGTKTSLRPSILTRDVWMAEESWAMPMSRTKTVDDGPRVTGRSFRSSGRSTIALLSRSTCSSPKYAVPGVTIRFPRRSAPTTSMGAKLRASMRAGSR